MADFCRGFCVRALTSLLAAAFLIAVDGSTADAQVSREGTLRVGIWSFPAGLGNPHQSAAQPSIYFWPAIFDGLTIFDADGNVQPALATAWELVNDTTWRFTLRSGVTFQNGEAFGPDAVVAAVRFLTSEEGRKTGIYNEMRALQDARAVDGDTVEIVTSRPEPILARLATAIRIPAPRYWSELGVTEFAKKPVGTGPFKVLEWTPGRIATEAFDESWRAPSLRALEFLAIPDAAARLQALLSDQIEIALGLNSEMTPQLDAAGHRMSVTPGTGVRVIVFRALPEDSPFRDPRVRLALNYAIDREALNAAFFNGQSIPAGQPAPRAAFGYDPTIPPYPYDPEKARMLLQDAGYDTSTRTVLEILTTEVGGFEAAYRRLPQDLAKVGVNVDLVAIPISEFIGKLFNRAPWAGWAFAFGFDTSPSLDSMRLDRWHTCHNNFAPWYCNREAQAVIDTAAQEMDLDKRRELVRQVMRMYHDDPPGIILMEEVDFDGLHRRVQNFAIAARQIHYEDVALAK